ncbi:esterase-like activity of phytase family protein [Chelativorans sp. EGI FJ00035]|uniref:Esterase-like activity of phytase family protein n=1 Tax=Chelativorans salis TaxID=2978478 RepID=A0ABT2LS70_9HYPH|nr:esterase-like activity of phytase family protein [Chelativorans sp. EGI FJ00035]MCT7377376.1 esterase-like activity of phytase family protein [Chelativorans sp. EGI FJ00035]
MGLSSTRAEEASQAYKITARPIAEFRIGSSEIRFGPLEFIGGLEMTSRSHPFGGLSSFRFLDAGRRFVGVADTGFWFFGALSHDAQGRPDGIDTFTMELIQDLEGNVSGEKWTTDAEAIAVKGDRVTVGFERAHRIAEFRLAPEGMGAATGELDFLIPAHELRMNRGLETVAYAPEDSALAGARVAVAERSIDTRGNVFAAILEGPLKGVFTVARSDNYDITDGAFLPDGALLLLERRFSMASGVAMRLRRISAESVRPGNVADGPVLIEADMGYQIDNMEALDVWRRADGALMISLLSDDNHSILQRNLYLEFRLHGE